jgi:hypothetical protein
MRALWVALALASTVAWADASTTGDGASGLDEERVKRLAGVERIEGPFIGHGPRKSEVYPLFRAVVDGRSAAQLEPLLRHSSPVVRGYVAMWILDRFPDEARRVAPLARDGAGVQAQFGCLGSEGPLAAFVAQRLCLRRTNRAVQEVLLGWATDPASPAEGTAFCVAEARPAEAHAIARTVLAQAPLSEASLHYGALRALAEQPEPIDAPLFARLLDADVAPGITGRALVQLNAPGARTRLLRAAKRDPQHKGYLEMLARSLPAGSRSR